MKKLLSISALLLALTGSAHADPDYGTVVLTSVDEFERGGASFTDDLAIVGVASGQSAAQTYFINFSVDQLRETCVQLAVVAMNRPGRFRLKVSGMMYSTDPGRVYGSSCRLIANH